MRHAFSSPPSPFSRPRTIARRRSTPARCSAALLSGVLLWGWSLGGPVGVGLARAEPGTEERGDGNAHSLTVDLSALGLQPALERETSEKIIERAEPLIQRRGLTADQVQSAIAWSDPDDLRYLVTIVIDGRSHPLETDADTGQDQIVLATIARLDRALAEHAEQEARARPPEAAPTPVVPPNVQPDRPPRVPHRGPLWWGGWSSLGVGALLMGVGGGLVARGTGGDSELIITDYRPPGYALLGTGGAVLLTGVGLLIAHGVKRRRATKRRSAALGGRTTAVVLRF